MKTTPKKVKTKEVVDWEVIDSKLDNILATIKRIQDNAVKTTKNVQHS